jgi:hypothetical protein
MSSMLNRIADPVFAPIALFVYRRPRQTLKMLESLARNPELAQSELWIFCEGAKGEGDRQAVGEVRQVIKSRAWAGSVKIVESEKNLGCAGSVMAGIDAVLEQHDRIIVLEDDLIVSPHFLSYMNAGLERYEKVDRMMQVCGYMFPAETRANGEDVLLLPIVSSWGWATWRRAWRQLEVEMESVAWLDQSRWRRYRFDLHGAYPYREMIDQQRRGEIDAWDIRWYLTVFRRNGLAAYPRKSLVINDGFQDGTHVTPARYATLLSTDFIPASWPKSVQPDAAALRSVEDLLHGQTRTLRQRARQLLDYLFPELRLKLRSQLVQLGLWRR